MPASFAIFGLPTIEVSGSPQDHMLRRVIFLFALVLQACASPAWNKPGASESELAADRLDCIGESQKRVTGGNVVPDQLVTDPARFDACMKRKGWQASR